LSELTRIGFKFRLNNFIIRLKLCIKNEFFSSGTHCKSSDKIGTTYNTGKNFVAAMKCGKPHHNDH